MSKKNKQEKKQSGKKKTVPLSNYNPNAMILGVFTLKPGEKRSVSLPTKKRRHVGWWTNLNWDQLNQCQRNCIKMQLKHFRTSISARRGGSLSAKPNKGQIEMVFENREKFSIPIQIYTREEKLSKSAKRRLRKKKKMTSANKKLRTKSVAKTKSSSP